MTRVTFNVQRYVPGRDAHVHWQAYRVNTHAGMTVLEGLQQIRESLDATLTWRHSCRMGVCGSCAMVVAGTPVLACNTQIQSLGRRKISLQALWNFPIARDLVADLTPMFAKHRQVVPYLIRADAAGAPSPDAQLRQAPAELDEYLQFAACIKCGACMAACPTMASDADFLGPMPLTAAHRYNSDSRDAGFAERKRALSRHHGIAHCHYAAECTRVCPKGVDPARAIQLMRRNLIKDLLMPGTAARVATPPPAPPTRKEPLRAPAFTVKQKEC